MNRGMAQINLLDEIIVDNFAGGGGASTGIELATGRPVTIAINHDPAAILMHQTNHPYTQHLQASVWDVDPVKVCAGRPVRLAWFSPDCKHFSKAKGAALVDRNIRGLAWIVLRWAGTVRPRVIILENVEEFQTWGPVRNGKPVKKKAGTTFQKWLKQLKDLGYKVDFRELVAADYGAPTIRKRFVLVARCDGQPIRWPKHTHAPIGSEAVRSGRCKPWVSAAEVIDWSIPCPSIFASKKEIMEQYGVKAVRPLADNTLRRAIRGVDKYTIKSGDPFILPTGYGERPGQAPRVQDIHKPLNTVVGSGKHNLCCLNLIQYHTEQSEYARAQGLEVPISTVDASNRYGLVTAHLTEYYGNGNPLPVSEPMHTVTAHDREGLTTAVMQPFHAGGYNGKGNKPDEPVNTVTSSGGQSLVCSHIVEFKGNDLGQRPSDPLRTATAGGGQFAACFTTVAKYAPGEQLYHWPEIRALLNKYCGYHLAEDEVLLIWLRGSWYYICDIGLRMLTPKELYAAMGFPVDYIIDRDYTGKAYPKTQQVARCGNAVCPPMARAVVAANMPEWCMIDIRTMAQLMEVVAV